MLKITIKSAKRIITTTEQSLSKWVYIVNVALVKLETFHNSKIITLKLSKWDDLSIRTLHIEYVLHLLVEFCKAALRLLLIYVWIISERVIGLYQVNKGWKLLNFIGQQTIPKVQRPFSLFYKLGLPAIEELIVCYCVMFSNQNPKMVKMDLVYALNERVFRLMYILEKGLLKLLNRISEFLWF